MFFTVFLELYSSFLCIGIDRLRNGTVDDAIKNQALHFLICLRRAPPRRFEVLRGECCIRQRPRQCQNLSGAVGWRELWDCLAVGDLFIVAAARPASLSKPAALSSAQR